ncbi:MAG: hypothetical protein MI923_19365 [Phycisphaerales bacterium]|nr:hypothetical protein [Phycisphaerales bacterium]
MSIVVECTTCQKRMKAPVRLAGKRARCKCGAAVEIPALPDSDPAPTELSDLLGLADGETIGGPRCPSCKTEMEDGTVVCMRCGYNQKTGEVMRLDLESTASPASAPAADTTSSKPVAVKRTGGVIKSDEPSAAGGIVKWLVILGVVAGACFLGWKIKNAITFSPRQQAKDDHAKITGGMNVTQVVKALGGRKPREVHSWEDPPKNATGPEALLPKLRKLAYAEDFMTTYSNGELKYGFVFVYRYSLRDFLVITFDEDGKVRSAEMDDPLEILGI